MNKQDISRKKYEEKNDLVSKSYKLHSSVVKDFAIACSQKKESMSRVLERLMQEYIQK